MSDLVMRGSVGGLLLALALSALPARSDEGAARVDEATIPAGWACVDEDALAERRGGLVVQDSDVVGNRVGRNSRTGEVTVSGAAFANTRGINTNIINTGNNVSIQSTVNVVIDLD
jgi:hypothetical protein